MGLETSETRFERWRTRGDGAALSEVFDELAPGLLRLAIHLVGDPAAAEDLVQQTFVTAMERAASWDARRPLGPWLQGILANHARDLRRSARRPHDPHFDLDAALAREEDAPLESASRRELAGELARAVDALEEPYRAAVLLRLRHGLEAADIAHVLGRSPGAVRVQLHRAREMLRKSLPAGIAGALVLLADSARGLEKVRNQVLEDAARLAPAAGAGGALLGGVVVMKKFLVAAAIVLALAAAWWWSQRPAEPLEVARGESIAAIEVSDARRPAPTRTEPIAPGDLADRAPVDLVAPGSAMALLPFPVRVVDGDTGAPLAGARLGFFAPRRSSWSEVRARWPDRFDDDPRGVFQRNDWPWFRANPTTSQCLGIQPVVSYEAPAEGEPPLATAISDAKGTAVVDLGPDQAFVVAECEGYVARGVPPILERVVRWRDATKYESRTFRDDALVVKLFRPRAVRGQLVGIDGERLRRVVRLEIAGRADGDPLPGGFHTEEAVGTWTVTTDADGAFQLVVGAPRVRFRALDTGWFVASSGIHPERRERWVYPHVQPAGDGALTWVPLRRNPVVVVRSAVDGAPVREFRMLVEEQGGFGTRDFVAQVHAEDGRVRLLSEHDLENESSRIGPLAIRVAAEGFEPGAVECADPLRADEIVVALRPGACPTVKGRVLDGGQPVAGATCLVAPGRKGGWSCEADRAEFSTTTDADGRFAACLPPGGWVVVVDHAGRTRCRFVEHPSPTEIEIELARDTAIEVVVDVDPDAPPAKISAQVQSGRDVHQSLEIDAKGRARFGSLPPGSYTVQVHRDDGTAITAAPGDAEFDLGADSTRTAHFPGARSAPERHARLVVDGLTRFEGWRAFASRPGAEPVAVEPDGRVPLDCRAGARLRVEDPRGRSYRFRVSEVAGEPQLRVARGRGALRGAVRLAGGAPYFGGVVVASFRADEYGLESVTCPLDPDGGFVVDALPPEARHLSIVDGRGNRSLGGFDEVWFECANEPSTAGSELAIVLPAGILDGGSRIALRGFARGAAGPEHGQKVSIRARLEQAGGALFVAGSAVVMSDGSYALVTVPAPSHIAACRLEGGTRLWELEFTLPADGPTARQDFDLR